MSILSFTTSIALASQNPIIDSLWSIYKLEKTDTGQVNILLSLTDLYSTLHRLDSAALLGQICLDKALILDNEKNIAEAYLRLANVFVEKRELEKASDYNTKALDRYQKLGDEQGIAGAYTIYGRIYSWQGNHTEAIAHLEKSRSLQERINDKLGLMLTLQRLGTICSFGLGQLEKGLRYINESIDIYQPNQGDLNGMKATSITAFSFEIKGEIYHQKKDYPKTLTNIFQCVNLAQKINDFYVLSLGFSTIGKVKEKLGDYEAAIEVYNKGLISSKALNDSAAINASLIDIGGFYRKQKNIEKALFFLNESLIYLKNSNYSYMSFVVFREIALMYIEMGDFEKAWTFVNKIDAGSTIFYADQKIWVNELVTKILVLEKKWKKALPYAEEALEHSIQQNNLERQYQACDYLMQINRGLGRYQKALEYAILKQERSDSLHQEENTKTAQRLTIEYETKEKDAAITLLEQEKKLQAVEITSQRYWNVLWGLVGGISLLLSFVFYLSHQRTKRLAQKETELRNKVQNLFANISHEFKTPLSILKIPLEELSRNEFRGNLQEIYNIMLKNVYRLSNLVNQMLDLAKLKEQNVQLNLEYNNPLDFIRTFVGQFSSYAAQKGIELFLQIPATPLSIHYDEEIMTKIFNNLLSNAIKFTEKGSVSIIIQYHAQSIEIKVIDTGKGIAKEQINTIFERYYFNPLDANRAANTGLGLSVVKQLVDLYKGSINVESVLGKGSTFTVNLPHSENFSTQELSQEMERLNLNTLLKKEAKSTYKIALSVPTYLGSSQLDAKGKASIAEKILIVEDNLDLNTLLYNRLTQKYRVYQAFNGVEGFEIASKITPDLIITDIMMVQMDGLSLAKKIQTTPETSHIPLIVLSALGKENQAKALEAGAIDFIGKPLVLCFKSFD